MAGLIELESPLKAGDTVLATILDPHGGNPKCRPCVVIEVEEDFCFVVAITISIAVEN